MDKKQPIHQRLGKLLKYQNLGVLATQNSGQPYASLVAFYVTDDLRNVFFVTPKTTRKFANLKANPMVALLVNSSTNQTDDFHRAISATIVGTAKEVSGSEKQPVLTRYLKKHPHLEDFAHSPSCALFKVSVKSCFMVENFQNVMELHLK